MPSRFPLAARVALTVGSLILLAGCGTTRSWVQKSSGQPATFGTSLTLPIPGAKR